MGLAKKNTTFLLQTKRVLDLFSQNMLNGTLVLKDLPIPKVCSRVAALYLNNFSSCHVHQLLQVVSYILRV